jgi:ABC-2 type transport system ATP-binding protein
MECVEGIRKPDSGTIAVLGRNSFRQVCAVEGIGVPLQQAQLQKRIKVWGAVDLWASLYGKKPIDGKKLLDQFGLADKQRASFMTPSEGQSAMLRVLLCLHSRVRVSTACSWTILPCSRTAMPPEASC